jgi:hypothetical protein
MHALHAIQLLKCHVPVFDQQIIRLAVTIVLHLFAFETLSLCRHVLHVRLYFRIYGTKLRRVRITTYIHVHAYISMYVRTYVHMYMYTTFRQSPSYCSRFYSCNANSTRQYSANTKPHRPKLASSDANQNCEKLSKLQREFCNIVFDCSKYWERYSRWDGENTLFFESNVL